MISARGFPFSSALAWLILWFVLQKYTRDLFSFFQFSMLSVVLIKGGMAGKNARPRSNNTGKDGGKLSSYKGDNMA
ncbi:hypothetical protein C5167_003012 [Papaver somniferum]|uniref:Uncharacterized protein n=1 Tax=Papaver somniferum TaxID=3469 RepID=A0A4Y7L3H8_PAPSO|nr:hypothetical protein C5167_003012 [Papaver somniferum]